MSFFSHFLTSWMMVIRLCALAQKSIHDNHNKNQWSHGFFFLQSRASERRVHKITFLNWGFGSYLVISIVYILKSCIKQRRRGKKYKVGYLLKVVYTCPPDTVYYFIWKISGKIDWNIINFHIIVMCSQWSFANGLYVMQQTVYLSFSLISFLPSHISEHRQSF